MEPGTPRDWMSTAESIGRLGVKPQTLYAYVSRGLIRRERVPGTHGSRYFRADIERLAARTRRTTPGNGPGSGPEIVVDSAVTLIDPAGHLYYRGWDVTDAAGDPSYEGVAEWLWGADPANPTDAGWSA